MPGAPIFSHQDRTVVVTGGGTGIGRALVLGFAAQGARVYACGRREDRLREVADEAGPAVRVMAADVTVPEQIEELAETARAETGKLDVWINNAGIIERAPLPEADLEHWERLFRINATGTFLGCRVALKRMLRQGRGVILNVSSYLSAHAGPSANIPAYTATKGAVSALTRSLAVRHGPDGIRVNAICPALVHSELSPDIWAKDDLAAHKHKLGERYPLRRVGEPEDVAAAALFLASDEASWITGIELVVDGGVSAI